MCLRVGAHRGPVVPFGLRCLACGASRLRRMQYRPALLEGFLASTGLDLTPFCNPHH